MKPQRSLIWGGLYFPVYRGRRGAKNNKEIEKDNYTVRLVVTSTVQDKKESKSREIASVPRRNELKF